MRQILWILLLGGGLAAGGCRLPNLRGPVPADLASSRQLCQQGVASLERGQAQEAETLLAEAVKVCSTDPDARRHYAEVLWARGNRAEAVRQMEAACRLNPEDAARQVRLAEMHLAEGRIEQAQQNAERAIDQSPKLSTAWAIRGRIRRSQGDLRGALADYHRALGYAPQDRQVLAEVADLYHQMQQPQRALETAQSLAETYSPGEEPQTVLCMLGASYSVLSRYDDAVECYSRAALGQRPTPELLFRLGEAQMLAGRTGEAALTLQQALALDPRHAPSRDLLSRIEVARASATVQR